MSFFIFDHRLSVTSDYDCISAMLLGSNKNGRLEVTQFSVPATSITVSVICRNAKCNTPGLTVPGSLNSCPICEGQRWILNVPMRLYGTWASKFRSQFKKLDNFRSLLKAFGQFDPVGTSSANSMIDRNFFQLRHPDSFWPQTY